MNLRIFRQSKELLIAMIAKCGQVLPDALYLKIIFKLNLGYNLNLKDPKTFQEKIQWLKLYDRRPEYTAMADKYAVKQYVANIIGREFIIPSLGVWDNVDDIDFNSLPEQFVLKTTHGGGGNGIIICKDKSKLNIDAIKSKLMKSLKSDIFKDYREWPYKNVPRKIIAEKCLTDPDNSDLKDYKFFCFNGKPLFCKVDYNRFSDHHANYYDCSWNLLPFGEEYFPPLKDHVEICPTNFDKMIELASKLSLGHKFIRVDLYNVVGKIYFGELTFYPASGLGEFTPPEWSHKLGELIDLHVTYP